MNNLVTNPIGVDRPIKRIQTALYEGLKKKWNEATDDNLEGYGRIYKNKRNGKNVPEQYIGDKEYKEVLLDDTKLCTFFFYVADTENVYGSKVEVDCEIYFTVDLSTVYGNAIRGDMETRNDIMLILDRESSFTMENVIKGLENVYSGWDIPSNFKDMQEFHHFKVKGKITYNINC